MINKVVLLGRVGRDPGRKSDMHMQIYTGGAEEISQRRRSGRGFYQLYCIWKACRICREVFCLWKEVLYCRTSADRILYQ